MRKLLCVIMVLLSCTLGWSADWLTDGGNPQRTGWQKDEHILNKDNVQNLQLLWKINLGNEPREMHSLLPTLVASNVPTPDGPREITITAGVSDNIYAVDAATGELLWKQHFEHTPPNPPTTGGTLCPAGQTATPLIGPADAAGNRTLYAIDGHGDLRQLNLADGKEKAPPIPFSWPAGKPYALNLWNDLLMTTSAQGCGGNPNQFWAIDLNDPQHKVITFNPGSGGLWGRTGAAFTAEGVAYAPTGDGVYDPETHVFGNGLVGVKAENGKLVLKDYFIPREWAWMRRRDLDMNVTPPVFNYKGRELMVMSSKECRLWLLDANHPGGADHQTPIYRTPLMCNQEVNFAAAGVWGSLATWEDTDGTRWVLSPFWGPPHPDFEVPVRCGTVTHGAIVALKVAEVDGKLQLVPAWMSRDMDQAEPPVVANGVVYAYGSGENASQATPEKGLDAGAPRRIPLSTHATLYALDARTGKELYSSGNQITSWNHWTGLSVANGRVYINTFDSTLYAFGLPKAQETSRQGPGPAGER
ncbi:MAG: PQQ-binding-like beta-propeller repeat protein [Acidobacteria bacterium]|nr:PQQ-binding-like beta-propeller repeat protein [Acidobacteriota bacterium]